MSDEIQNLKRAREAAIAERIQAVQQRLESEKSNREAIHYLCHVLNDDLGVSQAALGKHFGVSASAIKKWVHAGRTQEQKPTPEELQQIPNILKNIEEMPKPAKTSTIAEWTEAIKKNDRDYAAH